MEILEVLIAVLMIVAIFALVVMMNMRFNSTIDTYMPFRMAVLVANRLSGSPELTVTPAEGGSAHKNLLSAAKLDNYVKNYNETMPPSSALLCFHWRASVKEPDNVAFGYWEFGQNPMSDMPDRLLSAIVSLPETTRKLISENPINIFRFAFPPAIMTEAMMKEMLDMAPSSYSLPVNVMTDPGAISCASAGGKCRLWTGFYCLGGETDLDEKDCSQAILPRHCCTKTPYTSTNGATMPAMLEVSVWKLKSECRDEAVIQKILEEIKASANTQ